VKAVPTVIPRNGGTSEITVRLKDTNNQNIAQSEITITVTISSWTGTQSKKPTLTYAEQSGYSVIATTDSKGQAIIILTAGGAAGKATITASASGLTSGNTEVTIDGS